RRAKAVTELGQVLQGQGGEDFFQAAAHGAILGGANCGTMPSSISAGGSSTRAPCRMGRMKLWRRTRSSTSSRTMRASSQRDAHQRETRTVVSAAALGGRMYFDRLSWPRR